MEATRSKESTSLYHGTWVDGAGPLDAELLLVGRDPGRMEELRGEPFVGPSGQLLQECVREASLDWSRIRRTNAIRCRTPNNREPTDEELAEYRPWLLEEIASMPNLKVIVTLGNDAMKTLTRKSGISEKRGEEVEWSHPDTEKKATVLPTFHPSYVLRARAQRPTLVKDLVRARRLVSGESLADPAGGVVFEPDMIDAIDSGLGLSEIAAIDVETDENDAPRLFALGSRPDEIHVIPARGFPEAFDWKRNTWLGHNLRADQRWLRQIGVELGPRREDTMLMAHLLNENRRVGLKKLALELLDPRLYWKYVEPLLKNPVKRGNIPYEELGTYCANDVAATLLIYDVLSKQLASEPRLEALYRHMSLPLSDVLLDAETHGVLLDTEAAHRLLGALTTEVAAQDTALGTDVKNWNSDAQVSDYLYGTLGLTAPHKTKGGARGSVDQKALMKLRFQHPIVPKLIARALTQKKAEIVQSLLDHAESDGRIRTSFNQAGPVNARLASHDPNMQNIPTDSRFRSLIVAPGGRSILSADYKTLEIGIGAWVFRADDLLQAYLSGDVHTVTATKLLGRPPRDKDERKKFGKTPNFGLEYQQGDDGFREYAAKQGMEMTLDEAREMRAAWHNLYPGVREGWRRIGMEMKANDGTVTSPSGRRRRLPEFLSGSRSLVNEAWRAGSNFPVSCTAVELTHVSAILAAPALKSRYNADFTLHVHDQILFEVSTEAVPAAARDLRQIMEQEAPAYFERYFGTHIPIPLFAEVSSGSSWGTQKEVDLQVLA